MSITLIENHASYDFKHERVNQMADRLLNINWYQHVGTIHDDVQNKAEKFLQSLNIENCEIKWISKDEIGNIYDTIRLTNSSLWEALKVLPDRLKEKIDQSGQEEILNEIVYHLPEAVFHEVYKGAFKTFSDESFIRFLVGHAMYISLLACAWELVANINEWGENPFAYLVDILEMGHIPLGSNNQTFYIM
ncbi:hypothetical protein [Aeribacillus sp. FSL W8-0870]|uniref:hypothetical protein n=1 Tax=unclassified Aeribacillus TaxID=2640495 RepID=UPI0030D35375